MRDDPRGEVLRPPPFSLEAEQSVLGALLLSNAALESIDDRVVGADFYVAANRVIYGHIHDLIAHGKAADVVTVSEAMTGADELEDVGGLAYLGVLLQAVPTAANAAHYADIVRDKATRRRLAALGAEMADLAYSRDGRPIAELLDEVQRKALALTEAGAGEDEPIVLTDLLPGVVTAIEDRASGGAIPGLSTGITDLDAKLLGLHPGELMLLAGEPGSGKTTLGMQFGYTAARAGVPCAVFSLEMKPRALAERGVASVGMVNRNAMRNGRMDADDWSRASDAIAKLHAAAPILIDPSPSVSITRVRMKCKRLKRKYRIGLVVVDYIQLMTGEGDNQNERVGSISRGLKLLAMELDVPVVALSQLNRGLAQRTNKRPVMSDLRDSGSLEQDADAIVFVYRDELHNPDNEDAKGKAELIIRKQREGEVGSVFVTFLGQFNRFTNTEWRPRQTGSDAPRRARRDLDD